MPQLAHRKTLLYSFCVIIIILGLAEVFLRFAGVTPRVDNPFFMLVRVFEYPEYFQKDENLFWRLRHNITAQQKFIVDGSYRTNSLGLRGPEIDPGVLTDRVRIGCFGNSCTFGWQLKEEETYPVVLQEMLNSQTSGNKFHAFNCGVPGYSSFQGLKFIQLYQPMLRPQIVTICYGWNDHWAAGFDLEDKEQQMPPQFILDVQNTLSKSYLYRSVKYLLLSKWEKGREYTYDRQSPRYRVSLDDYRANLIKMIEFSRDHDVLPILMTSPVGDSDPGHDLPVEVYHSRYNDVVRKVARVQQVDLVDADSIFHEHPEYFDQPGEDFIHYNQAGAKRIATELVQIIVARRPGAQNSPR